MKSTNELDRIYNEMISSRDEQQIAVALKLMKKYIDNDRKRLWLLELQLRA